VLATQTLLLKRLEDDAKSASNGTLLPGVTAKDVVLHDHRRARHGRRHRPRRSSIAGQAIRDLSHRRPPDGLQHGDRGAAPAPA
jgi:homoaconitase/3-isopropylmalate dehydratase large subunit